MQKCDVLSKNYAKAIVETFDGDYKTLIDQLDCIKNMISSSQDFRLIMDKPSVSLEEKLSVIDSVFKKGTDKNIVNFMKILVEKRRLSDFDNICECAKDIVNSIENRKYVEIISAIELDDAIKTKIMIILETKLNCDVIPTWTVDKKIIAGLIFKYDDFIVDTSLKSRLVNLSKNILR